MFILSDKFRKKHLEGDGGINEICAIAMPMVLSSGFDAFVMFINRLMLAKISPLQMAAMLGGGLTCFTLNTFFLGLIGYSSAIIAHLYGAGRKSECSKMVFQSLLLALISFPFILLLIPLGNYSFELAGHSPALISLEREYFMFSMFVTSFISLIRTPFASFFAGIGKTKVILWANLIGMLANVISAYVLIFGNWGFPKLEIKGAALAIALGSLVNLFVLLFFYNTRKNHAEFDLSKSFIYRKDLTRRLMIYGFPAGLESIINLTAFTAMVSMFHSYGDTIASAVTVAFNWDLVSFVPMIGMQIAVTTLVGQNLGRGKEDAAIRSAYSGVKVITAYSSIMIFLFLFFPGKLADIFRPENARNWFEIRNIAVPMIMMMSVYPLSDGLLVVFSGAIRGAGDTKWAMIASAILHWTAALIVFLCIKIFALQPIYSWSILVLCFPCFGLVFWLRFRSGKWKGKHVITETPLPPSDNIEPSPFHTV